MLFTHKLNTTIFRKYQKIQSYSNDVEATKFNTTALERLLDRFGSNRQPAIFPAKGKPLVTVTLQDTL